MTLILLIQLLVSFVVGGCLITLLSLIAEKANENISGIIMMFPSTIVLGFFFLGYTTSANNVAAIIPATLIPLGIVIFSSVIYIYCSLLFVKYFKTKVNQIIATIIVSSIIWFILASPFAIFKFTNLVIGAVGFFVLISLSYIILNIKRPQHVISRPTYNKTQIVFRAIFTGFIIATVVFLGKMLNPFWGGVFTMFPAATFATLMILHFYYEPSQLFYFMKKAPIGSLSLFLYAISVMLFFPKYGIVIGSLFSYCMSLMFSLCLIKYKNNRHKMATMKS
jgi:uncharacterized membrane protein (GlpM family)